MLRSVLKHRTINGGILLLTILLAGCTANVSSTDANGLSPHLTVDLQVAHEIQVDQSTAFTISVQEKGQPYKEADHVEFVIWPIDHLENTISINGVQTEPGTYSASTVMAEEGVYAVQGHVKSEQYQVMPMKRFAIGEAAVHELILLQEQEAAGTSSDIPATGGHDHH